MTGPEHYRKAEELLEALDAMPVGAEASHAALTLATAGGAHATLALAAATALADRAAMPPADERSWLDAVSEQQADDDQAATDYRLSESPF